MTAKSTNEARKPVPGRLASALLLGHDAMHAVLVELGLDDNSSALFSKQAIELRQRAHGQVPQASSTELELALGVLWVLHGRQTQSESLVRP